MPVTAASLSRFRVEIPVIATTIAVIGIVYIHSASFDLHAGAYAPYAATQGKWLAVALAGFLGALAVPYTRIERHAYPLYFLALALLLGVHVFGATTNGARSWYKLGAAKLQPSELAKIAVICAVAKALMYRRDNATWRSFAAVALIAGPPILSILKEPDLGTVLVFTPAVLAMLFVAGGSPRHFVALLAAGGAGAVLAYRFVLSGYQRLRIDVFLDPAKDPLRAGYQTIQARTAIGSGGVWGQGWGQGSQTQLHVLPEARTDFIFSVIGEEGGFLVALLLLALLLGLLLACVDVAGRTREPFGRLVATGVASLFAGQTFVNCGMNLGVMPVTGVTLPLVSYGGSSLLTSFIALGLVANIAMHPVANLGRGYRD